MIARATAVSCLVALSVAPSTGCNPYDRHQGEYLAGSVDPAKFPKDYLGQGGKGNKPGGGLFVPISASVKGAPVSYYMFGLSAAQAGAADPLDVATLAPAIGYVFDPPSATSAIPKQGKCAAPADYKFDPQRDAVHFDQQNNLFTDLPDDTGAYVPIIAQSTVTSGGEPCQDIKSEATLLSRKDVMVKSMAADPTIPMSMAQGIADTPPKFLAWPIIDPAARVLSPTDDPGNPPLDATQIQHWGFYQQYLLAYLDGGYIPTKPDAKMNLKFVAQNLYFPDTVTVTDMMGVKSAGPGAVGTNNDILDAARADAGYSPLCQVASYTPKMGANMLPILANDVAQIDMATVKSGNLIYCLQLQ